MHLSTATVVFVVVQLAVAAASACNADNCLRAVVGEILHTTSMVSLASSADIFLASAFTTRHGSADCSSFLETTVSQPTVYGYHVPNDR